MEDYTDKWTQYLDSAVFAINTSIQSTTKFTPFMMMYGREPVFPLEAEKLGGVDYDDFASSISEANLDDYIEKVFEKQRKIFATADQRIKESQIKQKEQFRKRKGLVNYNLKEGDKVYRRNMKQKTRKGSKNEDKWLGPYTIVDLSKNICHLENKQGKLLKNCINLNQLKPCHSDTSNLGNVICGVHFVIITYAY